MSAVLNGNDTNTPNEPNTSADYSPGYTNAMRDADIRRAGYGGMIRDEHGAGDATEQSLRNQAIPQDAPPDLPFYLAEKYYWKRADSGRWYLSPKGAFLDYVTERAPRAVEFGIDNVFPGGQKGKTDESAIVDAMIEEVRSLTESFRAVNETAAKAFERFMVERCTLNAVYAATTQFELEQWAARAEANGQNVSEHQNYGEKESRLESFATEAGIAYAVVKEAFPQADLSAEAFTKAAKNRIYNEANFRGRELLNPAQINEQKAAEIEATKITVRRF